MLEVLGNLGVFGLAAIAALAWGFARVLDAPRWAGQAILLATVLIALAGLLLLPPGAPFRESVGGSVRAAVFVAIAAVPVLAYRRVLRRLRPGRGAPVQVTGRPAVVAEADALAADLRAQLGTAPETAFGLIHRHPDGHLVAGAVVRLAGEHARIAPVWWEEDADPETVTDPLIAALTHETARRGATRATLESAPPRIAAAFRAHAFRPACGDAAPLTRALP